MCQLGLSGAPSDLEGLHCELWDPKVKHMCLYVNYKYVCMPVFQMLADAHRGQKRPPSPREHRLQECEPPNVDGN